MSDLGEIIYFKYPADVRKGKIQVRQDNPSEEPYIDVWDVADPEPDTATIDTWRTELNGHKAQQSANAANKSQAENRLRNPMPTQSIPALRAMVDDILTYLELDV